MGTREARAARALLRMLGLRCVGEAPACRRCVMIAAPHTSRWDLLPMLLASRAFGLPISWFAQHTVFRGPLRPVMQALGGIPLEKHGRGGTVERLAAEFASREQLVLAIAPEGTSARADCWHAGFYRIAVAAGVPILPSYLDFATRTAGFGPLVHPSGDVRADMERIRAVYAGMRGRVEGAFGPVRLACEDAAPAEPG